jgi:hypothetical protein
MVRIIRAAEKKRDVVWIITPCIAEGGGHRFGGFCCPCLQGTRSIQTADKIMSQKAKYVPLTQLFYLVRAKVL